MPNSVRAPCLLEVAHAAGLLGNELLVREQRRPDGDSRWAQELETLVQRVLHSLGDQQLESCGQRVVSPGSLQRAIRGVGRTSCMMQFQQQGGGSP